MPKVKRTKAKAKTIPTEANFQSLVKPKVKRTKAKAKTVPTESKPTIAKVRRQPELAVFVPPQHDDAFKKDDCVFIRHDAMVNRGVGSEYYKMKIISFHTVGDKVWLLGFWCYSPEELTQLPLSKSYLDLIPTLGMTELIVTDHIDVVDALSIEDRCHLHHFDDKQTTCFPLKPDVSWFHRLEISNWNKSPRITGINYHCHCKTVYNPVDTVQRFCVSCKGWYDEGCMQSIGDPASVQGTTATEILKNVPYVRGWPKKQSAKDWMTVGTGQRHELVKAHAEEIDSAGSSLKEQWSAWEDVLGKGYVRYVQDTKFSLFSCPNCKGHI